MLFLFLFLLPLKVVVERVVERVFIFVPSFVSLNVDGLERKICTFLRKPLKTSPESFR